MFKHVICVLMILPAIMLEEMFPVRVLFLKRNAQLLNVNCCVLMGHVQVGSVCAVLDTLDNTVKLVSCVVGPVTI